MGLFWLCLIRQQRLTVSWTPSPLVLWMHPLVRRREELIACGPSVVFLYVWRAISCFKIKTYIWVTQVCCLSSVWQWLSVVAFKQWWVGGSRQPRVCRVVLHLVGFVILFFRTKANISDDMLQSSLTFNYWNLKMFNQLFTLTSLLLWIFHTFPLEICELLLQQFSSSSVQRLEFGISYYWLFFFRISLCLV